MQVWWYIMVLIIFYDFYLLQTESSESLKNDANYFNKVPTPLQ